MERVIYVGDAKDVIKRILTNHCRGNVEGSAFRKHVAESMGYKIKTTYRSSGSKKVRIDHPNPSEAEKKITAYIRSGKWKYVICDSYEETHDFQWYVIERLKPLLNKDCKAWNSKNFQRYQILLNQLESSKALDCEQLKNALSGPGVYVFYHTENLNYLGDK